ncbi:hypothetical protein B1A85_20090 [Chroococcidiopsis sp. TS-821]|nr:hypothetical protein B1A85_20090 [Chroococcidiopsis sp. TS-821]
MHTSLFITLALTFNFWYGCYVAQLFAVASDRKFVKKIDSVLQLLTKLVFFLPLSLGRLSFINCYLVIHSTAPGTKPQQKRANKNYG